VKLFELSIAWKYLLPKRGQLSVALISLISITVISLVVWLILVFFSITQGLEKGWIDKLISVTAPVRITPTDAYFNSYYHQIDFLSSASDYSPRSIGEKKDAAISDPYNPEEDEEIPDRFPKPDLKPNGELKDPVKELFWAIEQIPGTLAQEFEIAAAHVHMRLVRGGAINSLSQPVYLGSFERNNPSFGKTLLPLTEEDLKNARGIPTIKTLDELPYDEKIGYGLFAPKSYREAGILLGDRGFLSYTAPTISGFSEQRVPVFIAGFYDPGIVPLGGKFLWADRELVRTIRAGYQQEGIPVNGVHVRFADLSQAPFIKKTLEDELAKRGVGSYWRVETFREFDYAKDLLQQLRSEKHIFSLIAGVIMIVACSNIISMLIILVNNKRLEIGILRSMGAPSSSIAAIFGLCGAALGLAGSFFGMLLAFFTLRNLHALLQLISRIQGYDAFNPVFYGDHLPNSMNYDTLFAVVIATALLSLAAGLIPAIKASRMHPSAILRSE
jgi:lipoprotein-releasing system permease protein